MKNSITKIPVANIYFMLAYAWNLQPTWEKRLIDRSDYESLWELLAQLLVKSTENIFKKGIARDYVAIEEIIAGAKGRIDIGKTYRTLAWYNAKTHCNFDEFQSDIPINQAIKATIFRLLKSTGFPLESGTRTELKKLYQRFSEISFQESNMLRTLNSFKLQRHQRHYFFPVQLCKFILKNTVFNENKGKYEFIDFERDHQKMSHLFERFIFNYYKRHAVDWKVKRDIIHWHCEKGGVGEEFLPVMETDISLEKKDRKIVIDAKFYQQPMQSRNHYSAPKFDSAHLYQLFSYLNNLAKDESQCCNSTAEGMLLYPVIEPIPRLDKIISGHHIRVESIDLNQDWKSIGRDLERLIE